MGRFGFSGLCFVVAFILWAIQKGDAAVNPSLSWMTGLGWYSLSTLLVIAGIWLWDQTANRHIAIRSGLTVAACLIAIWMFYGPLRDQYRREHQTKIAQQADPPPPAATPPTATSTVGDKSASPNGAKAGFPREKDSKKLGPPTVPVQPPVSSQSGPAVGGITQTQAPCSGGIVVGGTGNTASGGNCGPIDLVLTDEQIALAKRHLETSSGAIRLILSSPVPNMANVTTTTLGNQILGLFSTWSVDSAFMGSAPIPIGITLVGDKESETVKKVVQAFDAAKIPYKLDSHGYRGPASLGTGGDLAITVSR